MYDYNLDLNNWLICSTGVPADWYCSLELIKVEYFTQICAQNAAKVFPIGAVCSMSDFLSWHLSGTKKMSQSLESLESTNAKFSSLTLVYLYIQNMDFCVWSVIKLIPSTEDKLWCWMVVSGLCLQLYMILFWFIGSRQGALICMDSIPKIRWERCGISHVWNVVSLPYIMLCFFRITHVFVM